MLLLKHRVLLLAVFSFSTVFVTGVVLSIVSNKAEKQSKAQSNSLSNIPSTDSDAAQEAPPSPPSSPPSPRPDPLSEEPKQALTFCALDREQALPGNLWPYEHVLKFELVEDVKTPAEPTPPAEGEKPDDAEGGAAEPEPAETKPVYKSVVISYAHQQTAIPYVRDPWMKFSPQEIPLGENMTVNMDDVHKAFPGKFKSLVLETPSSGKIKITVGLSVNIQMLAAEDTCFSLPFQAAFAKSFGGSPASAAGAGAPPKPTQT